MKKHFTKDKGDIGLMKVMCDLSTKGYVCYTTISEHQPFDIIAYNGSFLRVQVKYRKMIDGKITVPFRSSWADKNGSKNRYVDKSQVDVFAIFCPDTNECYYLDPKKYEKVVSLRVLPPKNSQQKHILWAKDHHTIPNVTGGVF